MNRAVKRQHQKLARKVSKNGGGHPPRPLGQNPGGPPASRVLELVQKAALLHQAGQMRDAETIYRQVLGIDLDHADANHLLGVLRYQLGDNAQGVELISKAIAAAPHDPAYHNNLGIPLNALGRWDDAVASYRKALAIKPDYAEAHNNLGIALAASGRPDDAIASYRKALAINPGYAAAHNNLGHAFRDSGRLEEAAACYRNVIAVNPDHAAAHNSLGNVLRNLGRVAEAIASYRTALAIDPDFAMAHRNMAKINQHSKYGADIKAMEKTYARPEISDKERTYLAFGLGKAFEDLQQYEKAFDFFLEGNAIKWRTQDYPVEEQEAFFHDLKEIFDASLFERWQGVGCGDETPIFVLGMPRSGTTLVEQILASHPEVHGAGEIETLSKVASKHFTGLTGAALAEGIRQCDATDFERMGMEYTSAIRNHSRKARFVTNKMPSNFQHIGLIKLILPNAKVIHCRRNPQDNCMSIFRCLFTSKNLAYANDLSELGRYYNRYRDLMEHWQSVLPDFFYSIQYEALVADQAEQTRALLEFCGLEWEDACLEFYKSDRPIMTASAEQVRRPIYKDSVQSWKRYEKQLTPLLEILG